MKEHIAKTLRIIVYSLLILLFLVNLLALGFYATIVILVSVVTSNFDIQIFGFLSIIVLIISAFFCIFYVKPLDKLRIPLLLVLVILQMLYLRFSLYIPTVDKVLSIETCIDNGRLWNDSENKCETK